jgi:hypothetical protein
MVVSPQELRVGDSFSVEVRVSGSSDVAHAPFHLRFNPRVLRFDHGEEGPFLSGDGNPTVFFANPDSTGGAVVVALSRLGRSGGVGGDGVLCRLHFTAIARGDAGLSFARARLKAPGNRALVSIFEPASVMVE